jgi:hypothetical protein
MAELLGISLAYNDSNKLAIKTLINSCELPSDIVDLICSYL